MTGVFGYGVLHIGGWLVSSKNLECASHQLRSQNDGERWPTQAVLPSCAALFRWAVRPWADPRCQFPVSVPTLVPVALVGIEEAPSRPVSPFVSSPASPTLEPSFPKLPSQRRFQTTAVEDATVFSKWQEKMLARLPSRETGHISGGYDGGKRSGDGGRDRDTRRAAKLPLAPEEQALVPAVAVEQGDGALPAALVALAGVPERGGIVEIRRDQHQVGELAGDGGLHVPGEAFGGAYHGTWQASQHGEKPLGRAWAGTEKEKEKGGLAFIVIDVYVRKSSSTYGIPSLRQLLILPSKRNHKLGYLGQ